MGVKAIRKQCLGDWWNDDSRILLIFETGRRRLDLDGFLLSCCVEDRDCPQASHNTLSFPSASE